MDVLEKYHAFYSKTAEELRRREEEADGEKDKLYKRLDEINEECADAVKKNDQDTYQVLSAERHFIYDRIEYLDAQEDSEESRQIRKDAAIMRNELKAAAYQARRELAQTVKAAFEKIREENEAAARRIGSYHAAAMNLENDILKEFDAQGRIYHEQFPEITAAVNKFLYDVEHTDGYITITS